MGALSGEKAARRAQGEGQGVKTAAEDVVTVQDRTVPVEQEAEEGGGRSRSEPGAPRPGSPAREFAGEEGRAAVSRSWERRV